MFTYLLFSDDIVHDVTDVFTAGHPALRPFRNLTRHRAKVPFQTRQSVPTKKHPRHRYDDDNDDDDNNDISYVFQHPPQTPVRSQPVMNLVGDDLNL